ncbi:hypothetical protein NQ314_012617, partial [Rhamnusium bicolor]
TIKASHKHYQKHSRESITKAIEDIKSNNLSYRKASRKCGIPTTVLFRHFKGYVRKYGGPTVFTEEEEYLLIQNINICSEWGYPLDTYDLRLVIKNYLDKFGKTSRRFKSNLLGQDFIYCFLKRNKARISLRFCENIKRTRANVSRDEINQYFDNLKECMRDVTPNHIVNYDETNLANDVKKKRVITRRGCKHPKRVINTTKSSTCIMFAASGDDQLLPVSLKIAWRQILLEWKKRDGMKEPSIPKSVFPSLLKQLMDALAPYARKNITSGFKKADIIPLNKEEVINCLPSDHLIGEDEVQATNDSFLDLLTPILKIICGLREKCKIRLRIKQLRISQL